MKEPQTLADYIDCLSLLESNTGLLYTTIADKVEMPLVRSLFKEIAIDSQKHSVILKGVSESITHTKGAQKECEKKISESWRMISKLQKEYSKIDKINAEDLPELSAKLKIFESIMGEEYYIFVQLKTLDLMVKEINQLYNIDLSSAKSIFINIISDEDRHREILETIERLVTKEEQASNSPILRYQNPDAWSQPTPSSN